VALLLLCAALVGTALGQPGFKDTDTVASGSGSGSWSPPPPPSPPPPVPPVFEGSANFPGAINPSNWLTNMANTLSGGASAGQGISVADIVITKLITKAVSKAGPINCTVNNTFPTTYQNQTVAGVQNATGVTAVSVTATPVCGAPLRRRLQAAGSQVATVDFSATSSDLALGPAMAASMANSTQFAQTLATSINGVTMAEITAGRRQLSVMAAITALDQQTPALETTIEFSITLPTTSNVSADSVVATTSDPAALASVCNSAKASDLIADVNASSITATVTQTTFTVPAQSAAPDVWAPQAGDLALNIAYPLPSGYSIAQVTGSGADPATVVALKATMMAVLVNDLSIPDSAHILFIGDFFVTVSAGVGRRQLQGTSVSIRTVILAAAGKTATELSTSLAAATDLSLVGTIEAAIAGGESELGEVTVASGVMFNVRLPVVLFSLLSTADQTAFVTAYIADIQAALGADSVLVSRVLGSQPTGTESLVESACTGCTVSGVMDKLMTTVPIPALFAASTSASKPYRRRLAINSGTATLSAPLYGTPYAFTTAGTSPSKISAAYGPSASWAMLLLAACVAALR